MANEEHVKILHQGVEGWNMWRAENLEVRPDLYGAILSGTNLGEADLNGADLRKAHLGGANLHYANLSEAILSGAHLNGADLRYANLREAHLFEADLFGADLGEAHLSEADLFGANFGEADLSEVNLFGADLREAHLSGAFLSEAFLNGADLRGADLRGAYLFGADLRRANLRKVDLGEAHLREAHLYETNFTNTNLTGARGLAECRHHGPSNIDHRTLAKSGPLPLVFLQGCGLSDWQIEAAKLHPDGLTQEQIATIGYEVIRLRADQPALSFHSVFISYADEDHDFAKRLHGDLQAKGVRCWFAPEEMKTGDKIDRRIEEAIHFHDKLLLILSTNSVHRKWIRREVVLAARKQKAGNRPVLFPIRIDDEYLRVKERWPGLIRKHWHIADFTQWTDIDAYHAAFDSLLDDLRK